jgi:ribosome-associated toxin RatA of RatAB toxin-antitoxin module
MARASHSIDVDVSPDRFLAVLQDYARYPEFQPDVKAIRVVARAGDHTEVAYSIDARLVLLDYTLEHVQRGPLRIEWRLLRGEVMKHNVGSWQLEPLERGGTRVTYTIELELGAGIPPGLERALAEQGLPRMLGNFKARAEKLYR